MYELNIYKSPWLENIKKLLDLNGMSNICNNVSNVSGTCLKHAFKLTSSDIYIGKT